MISFIVYGLREEVAGILEENDFNYYEYSGCFDIIARKSDILLLKVLHNIDSFQSEQAENLKILSRQLVAHSFLIGDHTTREPLQNGIVYERFDIPTITVNTFKNVIHNNNPTVFRFRGGLYAQIDSERLKEKRMKSNMTQSELAKKVGVTKKSIYEHEKKDMAAEYEIVKRIERIVGVVTEPVRTGFDSDVKKSAKTRFEAVVSKDLRGIGFDVDFVHQSPFNIIASEGKVMVLSEAQECLSKDRLQSLADLSDITKKSAVAITKEEMNSDLPSVTEKELKKMSKKEFLKAVR